jgi:hypothetical protein
MPLSYQLGFMIGPVSGGALSWYQSQAVSSLSPGRGTFSLRTRIRISLF